MNSNQRKYICIHGHFYQPSRENPWLEDIELQDSAYPFHDWNEKISEECYKGNSNSRILDKQGNIIKIVNNYSRMSFNFGPTLLSWMEKHQPEIYQTVLEGDKISQKRYHGHGSAIAQIYNHIIMPLANDRDKYTQIYWGIKDFQTRFRRYPEGMWLSETAVDYRTLEIMADLGIQFTILAPHQAKKIRKMEENTPWQEVNQTSLNTKQPYVCHLPSGKSIHLFFYNGPISHEVSFGDILSNGEKLANRLLKAFSQDNSQPELVHIATDGETYGHHHRFGDMALAYCLHYIEENKLATITNYGEYLEFHPPDHEVEIVENSSWSCSHGIERWRSDCGCYCGMHPGWQQKWRKPLREAMDWLRDQSIKIFKQEASAYFKDVWQARNEYISIILNRNPDHIESFLQEYSSYPFNSEEKTEVLTLLEMQRNAMLMYSSDGWFFDEISGIETIQILQYAARCIQLIQRFNHHSQEEEYLKVLEQAPSNIPRYQNGAKIYQLLIKPAMVDLIRVAAHYAISSLFDGYQKSIFCYQINQEKINRLESYKLKIAIGQANIRSEITWEEDKISFAVLHLGDYNVNGGVGSYMDEKAYDIMQNEIIKAFDRGDVAAIVRLMDQHFGTNSYSLWYLFKDEQRRVIREIMNLNLEQINTSLHQIYIDNYTMMNFLHQLNIPILQPFSSIAAYETNQELLALFSQEVIDLAKLEKLVQEAQDWSINLDHATLGFKISNWVNQSLDNLNVNLNSLNKIIQIIKVLNLLKPLALQLHLWKAQNIYFEMYQQEEMKAIREKAAQGDEKNKKWLSQFKQLGYILNVEVSLQ
jgi:alpha-amylase/alpha-mannosidase (GH57 family)